MSLSVVTIRNTVNLECVDFIIACTSMITETNSLNMHVHVSVNDVHVIHIDNTYM